MTERQKAFAKAAPGIIRNLELRGMEGYFFEDRESCVSAILAMMPKGSVVSWGGSASVTESGMMEALHNGDYELIDRAKASTPEEQRQLFARTVLSDYYFMSSNAITQQGELVNIDGNGNRAACLIHGPSHIMMIVGMNKLTANADDAVRRIRTMACPPNGVRLNTNTPCALTGTCNDCHAPACMCSHIIVTRNSRHKGRIKVFLVAEDLGY